MGDLVLTEDEVGAVMMKLQESGAEQSALHNQVLGEAPRVMYMHISVPRAEKIMEGGMEVPPSMDVATGSASSRLAVARPPSPATL